MPFSNPHVQIKFALQQNLKPAAISKLWDFFYEKKNHYYTSKMTDVPKKKSLEIDLKNHENQKKGVRGEGLL